MADRNREDEIKEIKATVKGLLERLDELAPEDEEAERKRANVAALRKKYPALRARR